MATDNALVHESPEDLALRLLQLYALPDRESPERKNAFKDLIELTRIGASPLKIVAAQQIPRFLDDFPDLEEDAINAVYDLCEDSLTEVRVEGYKAIVSVSRKNRKWGKRNVDVLVQLLQIDQESEVLVVKTALGEHLQIDTRTTLSVLCDQLIVPSQEPADEDEKSTRERLRALVLSYLVNDAKAHILDACKQTQLSRDIVDALKPSIPNFDLQDLFTLLQKLVFFLPGYMLKDEGTTDLFSSLIEAATKHTEPPNLGSTRPFLELLCSIATTGDFVRMGSFLDFLLTVFLHENRLEAYVPEDRIYILGVFGDTLAAFRPQGHAEAKIATWNVCPYVIEVCGRMLRLASDCHV
ncbi:apoptosis inhibitory protein 5-domain-containing protein [Schizophyllum amplum]|uniref:Apoptosis inhibitory protein 5-domain-containing protein n=1 Tax=Schizophyllum amplum TaxID=97359 RepID=A0A550CZI9_9AGAR|nr:apoptosis inhibitory protein 5-domain-containing protein [Auriculariopsis ampla]